MTTAEIHPVAFVEILDGGVVLTFDDGQGAFLSADVVHHAVEEAKELPEFSVVEQKAMLASSKMSANLLMYSPS